MKALFTLAPPVPLFPFPLNRRDKRESDGHWLVTYQNLEGELSEQAVPTPLTAGHWPKATTETVTFTQSCPFRTPVLPGSPVPLKGAGTGGKRRGETGTTSSGGLPFPVLPVSLGSRDKRETELTAGRWKK